MYSTRNSFKKMLLVTTAFTRYLSFILYVYTLQIFFEVENVELDHSLFELDQLKH